MAQQSENYQESAAAEKRESAFLAAALEARSLGKSAVPCPLCGGIIHVSTAAKKATIFATCDGCGMKFMEC